MNNRSVRRYGFLITVFTAILGIMSFRAARLMNMIETSLHIGTSIPILLDLPGSFSPPAAVNISSSFLPTSTAIATETPPSLATTDMASTTVITKTPVLFDTIGLYNETTMARMRALSSVDYFTCCGLGHRLSKNADAYYIASRVLNFSLRVTWNHCQLGNTTKQEVSQYLFGPQPPSMVETITSTGQAVRLHNEVFGFKKLVRAGIPGECHSNCAMNKYASDVEYYRQLQERFRLKDQVDDFVKVTFSQYSVIGIHVRAGNNETGDFRKKGRRILNREEWVNNMVQRLVNITEASNATKPPLLYIATDTPSMVGMFTTALEGIMPVKDFPQRRPEENKGVMFGGSKNFQQAGDDCLLNWENVVMDMMILSRADVIVAARPSSFSQSLPMILSYAREYPRVFPRPFCEVNYNATDIRCYESFPEWCCEGIGQFSLKGLAQRYDYLRVPTNVWTTEYVVRPRPREVWRQMYDRNFLPYEYDNS